MNLGFESSSKEWMNGSWMSLNQCYHNGQQAVIHNTFMQWCMKLEAIYRCMSTTRSSYVLGAMYIEMAICHSPLGILSNLIQLIRGVRSGWPSGWETVLTWQWWYWTVGMRMQVLTVSPNNRSPMYIICDLKHKFDIEMMTVSGPWSLTTKLTSIIFKYLYIIFHYIWLCILNTTKIQYTLKSTFPAYTQHFQICSKMKCCTLMQARKFLKTLKVT